MKEHAVMLVYRETQELLISNGGVKERNRRIDKRFEDISCNEFGVGVDE